MRRQIEILAPAGSIESLYASLKLGADAVYVGMDKYSARAYAKNPDIDQLVEALTYAHLRGKKIYLTVNTLLNDRELECDLYQRIAPLYEAGLDACIVQDLGVMSYLHECFPDMALHASTQMTLLSGEEAELYRGYGVTRFVPARELTIDEIRQTRAQTDLEIEVFVYGALCYCYSGRCLMSEEIGGRSGNRGMCAQPCRFVFDSPYGATHLLSTKDICTLMYIPDLVEVGIDSFKIEGRMKKKEYSAYIASLYRHYVDVYQEDGLDHYNDLVQDTESSLWRDIKRSADIYNRGGACGGYLFEQDLASIMYTKRNNHYGVEVGQVIQATPTYASFVATDDLHYQDVLEFRLEDGDEAYEYTVKDPSKKGDTVKANIKKGSKVYKGQKLYRTKNNELLAMIDDMIDSADDKIELKGVFTGGIGKPVTLSISAMGYEKIITGSILQSAHKRPVTASDIRARLDKMGETDYVWSDLSVDIDEGGFIPLGEVARMRRQGIALREEDMRHRLAPDARRSPQAPDAQPDARPVVNYEGPSLVGVSDPDQLALACKLPSDGAMPLIRLSDYPSGEWTGIPDVVRERHVAILFPDILKGDSLYRFEKSLEVASLPEKLHIDAIVINSHRSIILADSYIKVADSHKKSQTKNVIYIADESFYHTNDRAKEVLLSFGIYPSIPTVYGRKALMHTAGCIKRTFGICDGKPEMIPISTPKRDEFLVVNHCDSCYNTIYTKEPVRRSADRYKVDSPVRFDFTIESVDQMREVLRRWNLL